MAMKKQKRAPDGVLFYALIGAMKRNRKSFPPKI